jgi:hypothetical protein
MNTSEHHGRAHPAARARDRRFPARRVLATASAAALVATGSIAVATSAQASPGQSVTSLRTLEPEDLAATVAGRGVDVRSARFTGVPVQAGRFGGLDSTGIASGVALSTGSVIDADPQSDDDTDFTRSSVLGPNQSLTTTGDLGGAGSADLEELFGATTYDAAVLTMRVVPRNANLRLTYVFGSEEYAGWSERDFTDSFAVWVNGRPCSYVPRTRDLVSTATVNDATNADRYVANFAPNDPDAGTHDTELNGFTTSLTCEVKVRAKRVATVVVAVADTADGQLDSTVLLARDGLVSSGKGGGGGHGKGDDRGQGRGDHRGGWNGHHAQRR